MDQKVLNKIHQAVLMRILEHMKELEEELKKQDAGIASNLQAASSPAGTSSAGATDETVNALITMARSAGLSDENILGLLKETAEEVGEKCGGDEGGLMV
ncbi:hypothetical protein PMIN03_006536 [Paraphaeosphaeria minitans]